MLLFSRWDIAGGGIIMAVPGGWTERIDCVPGWFNSIPCHYRFCLLTTILISAILTVVTIAWHYWSINLLYDFMPDNQDHSHFLRSVAALILLFIVHIVEIIWFTGGLYLVNSLGEGGFTAEFQHTALDYFYFSAVTYTTLGLSSFNPTDSLKLLTGLEALTGFVMLTWSATFFYNLTGKHGKDI